MSQWLPTPALGRALMLGGAGAAAAVALGAPSVLVLTAPLLVAALIALWRRPATDRPPVLAAALDHRSLHEGQGATSRLALTVPRPGDVEQVTRAMTPTPYVAFDPPSGVAAALVGRDGTGSPVLDVGPRRWGRRLLGAEVVALTSPWAGFRVGPVALDGVLVWVLPAAPAFESRAQAPSPVGLVGANRSRRLGAGTEFADIRPFRPGDRLRRISWRVSVRTGELHVTTSPAEQDTGVLLVLDAFADHGRSDGVGGAASSLDLGVRAASALAAHHVRQGDRVALRVVGGDGGVIGAGSGRRHLRMLQDTLAGVRPGDLPEGITSRLQVRVPAGSLVYVLSPMLDQAIVTATAGLARRGLPVVVLDTLPSDAEAAVPGGVDPLLAGLAWRMRRLEREQVLAALSALGCPVVAWRGPGTVDDVLQRLARRAGAPVGSR